MASKTPKFDEITPDAPRVSAALDEYDLSEATIERRIVRDGGTVELRVVVPLPSDLVAEPEAVEPEAVEPEAVEAEAVEAEAEIEPAAE